MFVNLILRLNENIKVQMRLGNLISNNVICCLKLLFCLIGVFCAFLLGGGGGV